MVQVLERPLSEKERFMMSFQQSAPQLKEAFTAAMQPWKDEKEREALQRLTGQDLSGLSPDVVRKMAGRNPYEQLQQSRLAADSLFKQYSTRIKEMQNYLTSGMYGKGEADTVRKTIKDLQDERDSMFGWSQKVKEPTVSSPEVATEPMIEESPKKVKKKAKEKFDVANPKHKARRDEVLKKTKNNREEAEKILLMEYDL